MSTGLSCCNGNGYNPLTQVCSDVSDQLSGGYLLRISIIQNIEMYNLLRNVSLILLFIPGCGNGVVCPVSQASTAFCNRCDFDRRAQRCGSAPVVPSTVPTTVNNQDFCWSIAERVYRGTDLIFTGTASG